MARHHMVNGEKVMYTAEEEAERDVEEAKWKEHIETVVIPNQYKRNRVHGTLTSKTKYPSIGDQLDALYHAGVFPEDMAAKIKIVKDEYPKE